MITKRNLLIQKREMKEGDFEDLLCKTNKSRDLNFANLQIKKIDKLNTIKTNTPLIKEVMTECGVVVVK